MLGLERVIGWRYICAVRGHRRLRFGAAVATVGVAIGVAALVIVLSVMNGYADVINGRLLSVNAHLIVRKAYDEAFGGHARLGEAIEAVEGVRSVTPFGRAEGFVLHKPDDGPLRRAGVLLRGTTPRALDASIEISQYLIEGASEVERDRGEGRFGVLIGAHLADQLHASVGDEVHVSTLPRDLLLGRVPPLRRYVVSGVFRTGYYEFDSTLILTSLSALQRDLGWSGRVTGLRVRLDDPFAVDAVGERIQPILRAETAGLFSTSWIYEHGNLYVWIRMQKWFSVIALGLIVIVGGFNVISVLTVSVIERRRDIGILKMMGCPPRTIARIFTLQGIALGTVGVAAGCGLGALLCQLQSSVGFVRLRGDVYMIDALPVKMATSDFGLVAALALVLCVLFSFVPARDAGSLEPVDAIRSG